MSYQKPAYKPWLLTDLIREVGGWPINIDAVAAVLDAADIVLADIGGKDYKGKLTLEQTNAILKESGLGLSLDAE